MEAPDPPAPERPAQPPAAHPPGYTGPVPPGAYGAAPPVVPGTGPYVLAEWWRRVVAALIDGAIIVAIALVILAIFGGVFSIGFLGGDTAGTVSVIVGLVIGVLAVAIAALFYAPLIMARTNGRTWGKMAMGIRVIRTSGERMDFGWSALREVAVKNFAVNLANTFTFGLAFFADVLWPLWDDENRALHDYVCQTRVVRT
jgi:uncharacterized RDD family membrane protein YckC